MRTLAASAATLTAGAALAVVFDANAVGDVFLVASATVSWVFTLLYSTRSRWRLLNAGRSLLYVFIALSFVLTQNALSVYLGSDYWGRGVIRDLEYVSLFVAIVSMVNTLWRIQRSERRTECPKKAAEEGERS
ncbi:hypothetical protein BJF84_21245 [Rhodococcus sp. CUA-806]|jgi:hypothetical protein|nr:hypothetical protein BJF84_21245 [Rhodococcus sp. CUA-806]